MNEELQVYAAAATDSAHAFHQHWSRDSDLSDKLHISYNDGESEKDNQPAKWDAQIDKLGREFLSQASTDG